MRRVKSWIGARHGDGLFASVKIVRASAQGKGIDTRPRRVRVLLVPAESHRSTDAGRLDAVHSLRRTEKLSIGKSKLNCGGWGLL